MKLFELFNDVYYHGTNSEVFDKFDHKYTGGIGFHFTKDLEHAKSFGKNVIKAKLTMNNTAPVELWGEALNRAYGGNPRRMAVEWLKKQGYDSVETKYETIIFEPEQIHVI